MNHLVDSYGAASTARVGWNYIQSPQQGFVFYHLFKVVSQLQSLQPDWYFLNKLENTSGAPELTSHSTVKGALPSTTAK